MEPLLSSRLFRRAPSVADLALARRITFFDFALWLEDFIDSPRACRDVALAVRDLGARLPSCHLPIEQNGTPLDLAGTLLQRLAALDWYQRAMDRACELNTQLCVAHVQPVRDDAVSRLFEAAEERGLSLALETDVAPHTSLPEMIHFLRQAAGGTLRHGLCVDLSRTQPPSDFLKGLDVRVSMIEVSVARNGLRHQPPTETDDELRSLVQRFVELPYVTYEIVPEGPPGVPPGEAELTMVLRRLSAWHRSEARQPLYEGAGASI